MASPLDTLLASVKNKITSTASRLFGQGQSFVQQNPTAAGMVRRAITPPIQQGFNKVGQGVGDYIRGPISPLASRGFEKITQPIRQFGGNVVQDYIQRLPGKIGSTIRMNPASQFGQQITNTPIKERLGQMGNAMSLGLDVATLPFGGGVVKNVAGQLGQQGFKMAVKQGAKAGATFGGLYGGLESLFTGKDEQDIRKYVVNALKSTAIGAGAGGVLGGGLGGVGFGAGKVMGKIQSLTNRTPIVESQLRKMRGLWVEGSVPKKPPMMPKAQWEFQLKFNKKYGRNPYEPVYGDDLSKAFKIEAEKRIGLQARPIGADAIPEKPLSLTQATGGVIGGVPNMAKLPTAEAPIAPRTAGIQGGARVSEIPSSTIPKIIPMTGKIPVQRPLETVPTPQETLVNTIAQSSKMKERKFITTVKESVKTAQEVKNIVEGQYIPKANDALSQSARRQIKIDINAARTKALEGLDDESVAIANELIGHYSAVKDYDTAVYIANTAAENLTNHGRAVQAASLYDKLTPEGIQRYAASQLQKVKMKLKPEDTKRLYNMAKSVQGMAPGIQKSMAQQKMMEEVQKLIPTPITQKIITLWKAGLLTGLKTTGRNITGNTIQSIAETIKDAPATLVDAIASIFTGQRTKTFTTRGTISGAEEGVKRGIQYLTTGFDERRMAVKLDNRFVNWGNSPIGKAAKVYTDTVFRVLGSQDQPFYYAALKRSLYDQAGAQAINAGKSGNKAFIENLVNNPTEQMIKTSVLNAETAVFQNKTALGSAINKAKDSIRKASPAGGAIADFLMPFTGVPSAIAGQVINYSPIGLAKTIVESIGKGKFDQRAFSEGVGRGIIGTAVIAYGVALSKRGLMTLDLPKSEKERNQWELEGKKPFSINVNGEWKTIGSIGPQATALLIGGYYNQGGISSAIFGGLKAQKEQTFLKGISTAMDAIDNPQGYGKGFVRSTAGSIIPTIIGDVAKAMDASQREINTPQEAIKAKLPGYRQELLPKRNVLGEVIPNEQGFLGTMIDIFNSSSVKSAPVINELRRLLDAGYNTTPSKVDKIQTVSGEKVSLTSQLQDVLESQAGPQVKRMWEQAIFSPEYQGLTDQNKAKYLEKILDDTRAVEKLKVTSQVNPSASTRALLDLTKNQRSYLTTGQLPVKLPETKEVKDLTLAQIEMGRQILDSSVANKGDMLATLIAQTAKPKKVAGLKPTFKKSKKFRFKKTKLPRLAKIKAKKIKLLKSKRISLKALKQPKITKVQRV